MLHSIVSEMHNELMSLGPMNTAHRHFSSINGQMDLSASLVRHHPPLSLFVLEVTGQTANNNNNNHSNHNNSGRPPTGRPPRVPPPPPPPPPPQMPKNAQTSTAEVDGNFF